MNFVQKYINYIKDNPKGYWFKRKLFGYGWTPVKWQGWLTTFLYAASLIYIFLRIDRNSHSASDTLIGVFIPFIAVTLILIAICYLTGEKPRWMWGFPPDDK